MRNTCRQFYLALLAACAAAYGGNDEPLGGEVIVAAAIDKGQTDMMAVLTEFAEAGPDGIFFPLFEVEGSLFAEQARAFDGLEGATLITSSAIFVSGFLGTPHSEGLYFSAAASGHRSNVNAATGKSANEVLAAYEATARLRPDALTSQTDAHRPRLRRLQAVEP